MSAIRSFRSVAVLRAAAAVTAGILLQVANLGAQSPSTGNLAPSRLAEPSIDAEYTAAIRQHTTEPFFLTPLIDHLPASSSVPTTTQVLGRAVGTPNVLHYPEEVNRYMRAVAAASPRVEVMSMGETEEGREMILVVVADEATIANLGRYKEYLARLADPRRTPSADAESIIAVAKPIYWATGAMHSPETGSPEMLMELVYRLAVGESEFIRNIRENVIVMATPIVEVDGRAKVVDLHMAGHSDPAASLAPRPLYWGAYVAHDNNRDGIGLSLRLTQHIMRTFLEYNPTIIHDLHESASYLYTSTGRGPYNAWIDPITINEWNRLAYREVQDMTAMGVPGIYTFDFYDGWAPNYMMWIANARNSIGRFYETQGAGNAATRVLTTNVDRQWHRPNTPLRQVLWSLRNNVNLQQSTILLALDEVAQNREQYLRNFYLKSQRSVAKARTEGPAAYVFPASDPRPGQQARLLSLLQQQGIEVHRAERAFSVAERSFPAGSYVIRLDQPFSRTADMLLDRQYYNPNDPSPYDDVGWTLGPLFNVETVRITDVGVLNQPMTLLMQPVRAPGGVVASDRNARFYLIHYNADNNLSAFRLQNPDLHIEAAQQAFTAAGRTFGAGSFIIPVDGNVAELPARLETAGHEFGFTAYGVSTAPTGARHSLDAPRIAVLHTWQTTQTEGWLRVGLDEYGIPYDYISVHDVRDNARLRDRYDVILFGPSSNDALSIVRGVTGDRPIPWQASELTPNIGRQASTPDMRGGLELTGVLNLSEFVKAGGVLVTLTTSSSLPIHFGLAPGVSTQQANGLWAPGGVFRTRVEDASSPLVYGYAEELGVYFNSGPILSDGRQRPVSGLPASGANVGATTARRSGRGGLDEQDIVQGRSGDLGQLAVEEFRREQAAAQQAAAGDETGGSSGTASGSTARTVLRFSPDVRNLLISGGLQNGNQLAGAPALIDAPYGDGHVVLFSFNPFWRGSTLGSYGLVFNALLHHANLDAGQARPSRGTATTTTNFGP